VPARWTSLRNLHLLLSLVAGLPLTVVALTGLPVTFWFVTDRLTDPSFYASVAHGRPADLDGLIDSARASAPHAAIDSVFLNLDGATAIASVRPPGSDRVRELALDRTSGALLAERWQDESWISRAYALHTGL